MPLFVVTATHSSDQCPMTNAKTRKLFKRANEVRPTAVKKAGVKLLVGPIYSINHKIIVVAEAPKVEQVMEVIKEIRVAQWNSIDVQPYMTAEDAAKTVDEVEPLY